MPFLGTLFRYFTISRPFFHLRYIHCYYIFATYLYLLYQSKARCESLGKKGEQQIEHKREQVRKYFCMNLCVSVLFYVCADILQRKHNTCNKKRQKMNALLRCYTYLLMCPYKRVIHRRLVVPRYFQFERPEKILNWDLHEVQC